MKKLKTSISILLISIIFFSFLKTKEEENVLKYFINPKLDNITYKTFKSSNGPVPKIIIKYIIKENIDNKNGIQMEYLFMNSDSIPVYGGVEKINKNRIEILEQYLFMNNRKIQADKIEGRIWVPNSDLPQSISTEFLEKETGNRIKIDTKTFARFKDTLGQKSFVVEIKSRVKTYIDGQETQEIKSNSKRLYVKNKGMVYYGEISNGKRSDYYLVEK